MDLGEIKNKADEGVWMVVTDPKTGDDTDIQIKLAGRDSKIFKNQLTAYQDKARQKAKGLSPAESNKFTKSTYVACTLDWKHVEENGEEIEFTQQNVKRLYEKYNWLYEQVVDFVDDRVNFLA